MCITSKRVDFYFKNIFRDFQRKFLPWEIL